MCYSITMEYTEEQRAYFAECGRRGAQKRWGEKTPEEKKAHMELVRAGKNK